MTSYDDSFNNLDDLSIVDALVQVSFLIQNILAKIGAEHDLSVIQIRLLGILRDREPSMQQLARHLGLDKSSITGLVDRAERRGLVERTVSSSDRRGFNVRATAVGWQIIHEVGEQIEHQITAMTVGLTESERTQTIVLAGKILAAAAGANR
ncbi:MarR family winged helix-turn-helix transcriptional regulator [Paenibacillus jilunlii]|uniref:Transcriptional regulator n=1 Tax=Paenibacillus jilunlii TaxID=682956 RepID=A0A1G9FYZ9_9BACL|nr:MarR family transcriptional regulator [Paenibacillus jilunlii]KWX71283.1 transcriptional regulator [Paenibacillus jilunlii]SDK93608.1 DNA-binding transcriptional regulator, MarR family [Paenibacillus jilunlii]